MNDESGDGNAEGGLRRAFGGDTTTRIVLAVTALAVLARFVSLGARTFHWDEARVGYWALRYADSGFWTYRPVAGGPFLYHLLEAVFTLVPASDYLARAPVALLGGALPLVSLLVRDRFDDTETVVLAVVLAVSPTLLYYGRFLRGDVPLAAFGLFAVGFVVRYRDVAGRRYLYGAAAAFTLALTASGYVVAYLACWALAAFLVFDHRRLLGVGREETAARVGDAVAWVRAESTALARAALLSLAIFVYAFAPRAGDTDGPGLFRPSTYPDVADVVFVRSFERFVHIWVNRREGHALLDGLTAYADLLSATALPLVALAVVGFLYARYVEGVNERPLVMFAAYWGGAGLFVVPVVAESVDPWTAVHVVAPLTLPAAVAGGLLVGYARQSLRAGTPSGIVVSVLLVLALVVPAATLVSGEVYDSPAPGDSLVQYGQPATDMDSFHASVRLAIEGNSGTDVLFVGQRFYVGSTQSVDTPPVPNDFAQRLPLAWYLERLDAETDDVFATSEFPENPPPVVITDPGYRDALESQLTDYRVVEYRTALWNRRVVVFYDTSAN